ncbi:MAG: lysozyme [Cyanobacteria bacterium J06621_12]
MFEIIKMRLLSSNINYCGYILAILGGVFGFTDNMPKSHAASQFSSLESVNSIWDKSARNSPGNILLSQSLVSSNLAVLPETRNLVKQFEGFRSYAYIDSSGLPVIGYGQTRVNGRTVRMGQYITQAQANVALEQELYHIQKLVLNHVKVDLNPYQLGALTSLVYNAGTVVIKNSTLSRKLNAGDYVGASQEFVRWNKANRGGQLVVFPGLTKRRLAEKKLFLTPYDQLASNN